MLLPTSNESFNRGSHFAVVVTVIHLSRAHVGHDMGIDLGPQVICDNALILHVIALQNASLFQLVECRDDLLKGAIDNSPRFVNVSFYFCCNSSVPYIEIPSYVVYDVQI